MLRRQFLPFIAMTAVPAWAQGALPVIGFLNPTSEATYSFTAEAFRAGLKEEGFADGVNCRIDYRWGNGSYDHLGALAAQLAKDGVTVIAATGDVASAKAAQAATSTIPVVFTIGGDPVRFGLVASWGKPGRNVTGVSLLTAVELTGKRIQLLRDFSAGIIRIGLLMNPENFTAQSEKRDAELAATSLGASTIAIDVRTPPEIDAAFAHFALRGVHGVVVGTDPFLISRRDQIIAHAARYRIAGAYPFRQFPDAGGLLSHGPSLTWMYHEAGKYVGRILRGARPADMPVLQPTRYETVINLKTAKSLGLTMSPTLAVRADHIIE